ncbi:hypothetical protein ANN_26131 [Periplaneta americana]|uniref:Transposable element P transposase-like RNase H domain-containing protein n=1 Tax=Periplaneta americana TaxID=6978 RepID=A0ABQ8S5F7_PERAM|nr:hypothetical protein ANN_26131 [Periplaneta americana]
MRNIYYHEKAATIASLRCARGSETRAQRASELPEMTSQGIELTTTELSSESTHAVLAPDVSLMMSDSQLTCFSVSPALSSSPRIANATAKLYCMTARAVGSEFGNHAAKNKFSENNVNSLRESDIGNSEAEQDGVILNNVQGMDDSDYEFLCSPFLDDTSNRGVMGSGVSKLLKSLLSQVPFDAVLNTALLRVIEAEVKNMHENDKYCALLFDEMSLDSGLYYESNKQIICGYQDLGHLGHSPVAASHALVFMLRGIRRTLKQVIAYYFTAEDKEDIYEKEEINNRFETNVDEIELEELEIALRNTKTGRQREVIN